MNEHDRDRMKKLLQQSLPPVNADSEPARDLWPAMLRRLDEESAAPACLCALDSTGPGSTGLSRLGSWRSSHFFRRAIPLLLYYL